jgi:hypothetical protein
MEHKGATSFLIFPLKRAWFAFALAFCAFSILAYLSPVQAQNGSLSGPEPGSTDPVGAPAYYTTLASDDLGFAFALQAPFIVPVYSVDENNDFDPRFPLTAGIFHLTDPRSALVASGHILEQNREDIVAAAFQRFDRRAVRTEVGTVVYEFPGAAVPFADSPNLLALATGDLDKVPDANGINHDEVVIASPDSFNRLGVSVNLNVLNYTNSVEGEPPSHTQLAGVLSATFPQAPLSDGPLIDDQLFAVAIGDFDGDGQNEIALAAISGSSVQLQFYRYSRASPSSVPSLKKISNNTYNYRESLGSNVFLVPTISLIAGNFTGEYGKSELVLALNARFRNVDGSYAPISENVLQVIKTDAELKPTFGTPLVDDMQNLSGETTQTRIKAVSGLFTYNPVIGFDLYRREIAVAFNSRRPANNAQAAQNLTLKTYNINSDLQIKPMNVPRILNNQQVDARFDIAAGGFAVNGRLVAPTWSIAVMGLKYLQSTNSLLTVSMIQPNAGVVTEEQIYQACACGTNIMRPQLVATDYQGKSIFLGAPVHFRINNLPKTDFVLEEPPKHAYWDPRQEEEEEKEVINVSRFPGINSSFTTAEGTSFKGTSQDNSDLSLGASQEFSAGQTIKAELPLLYAAKASFEVEQKASYNYEQNQERYDSNYAERTLKEEAVAENDDLLRGQLQTFDIWRYRILAAPVTDPDG